MPLLGSPLCIADGRRCAGPASERLKDLLVARRALRFRRHAARGSSLLSVLPGAPVLNTLASLPPPSLSHARARSPALRAFLRRLGRRRPVSRRWPGRPPPRRRRPAEHRHLVQGQQHGRRACAADGGLARRQRRPGRVRPGPPGRVPPNRHHVRGHQLAKVDHRHEQDAVQARRRGKGPEGQERGGHHCRVHLYRVQAGARRTHLQGDCRPHQRLEEGAFARGRASLLRRAESPSSPQEIAAAFKQIDKLFDTHSPHGAASTDLDSLISRLCNHLALSVPLQRACAAAGQRAVDDGVLAGRNPITIASSCILFVSALWGQRVDPKRIAEVGGVQDSTIRTGYRCVSLSLSLSLSWVGPRVDDRAHARGGTGSS